MAIFLIRHGETASNAARIVQTPETPLSARGIAQAERLARRLAGLGVAAIVSSDLARAVMTAERVRAATGAAIELRADLQERNFGDVRGYSDRINHAFTYAAKHYAPRAPAHAPLPFLAHPSNVAVILVRHGADETTVVASIVHHLIEIASEAERHDVEQRICERFGPVVLGVACDASTPRYDSHGEAMPWRSRKREVMRQLATMEPRALDIRCADEIHECGSAIATVQRLGPEYLEVNGLAASREVVAWYDDLASALGRRLDWPSHPMREELRSLAGRLAALVRR